MKEKNELFAEVCSHYNEAELKKHKEKGKNEFPGEPCSDYIEAELKKHKKKKNELLVEPCSDYSETELKKHKKKKKERNELLAEPCSDYNEAELKKLKKKKLETNEFLGEPCSDYIETELKKHKKKKKEKNELFAEPCSDYNEAELKKHKKKKKERNELFAEPCSDYNEADLKKHKKKKEENNEFLVERCSSFNEDELFPESYCYLDETESKHHKKKKRKNELFAKPFSGYNEAELNQYKINDKEKDKLFAKAYSHLNEAESKQHKTEEKELPVDFNETGLKKHKKKNKEKREFFEEACSYLNKAELKQQKKKKELFAEECSGFDEDKFEHKKDKTELSDLYLAGFPSEKNRDKYLSHFETRTSFSEPEANFGHKKKHKKGKKEKNLNTIENVITIGRSEILSRKQEKDNIHTNVGGTGISNEVFNKREKKNRTERKQKETKSYSNNTESYILLNEHNATSNYSLNEKHTKQEKSYLNATETSVLFEKSKESKKYKTTEDSLFNLEVNELSKKFSIESRNKSNKKHLMADDFGESPVNYKKHKSKHKKDNSLNYVLTNDDDDANLKLNVQDSLNNINLYPDSAVVDNAFNDRNNKQSSNHRKKYEKTKESLNSIKKKHKKSKENKSTAEVNENRDNLKLNFTESEKTAGVSETCFPLIDSSVFNSSDITRNCTETDSNILFEKEITHSINMHKKNKDDNYVITDTSDIFKNKWPENSALNTSEFNEDNENNSDHPIMNEQEAAITMDYTDKLMKDFLDKNASNLDKTGYSPQRSEYSYFSSLDCNEQPVDFKVPFLHESELISRFNEKQKAELLASGVSFKTGKFTLAEDEIIKKNFNEFSKEFGISDPVFLLGIGRDKKDYELLRFLKAKHFYVRLAKDLNDRTLYSIYKRARCILNPHRNVGKLTKDEIECLKQLRSVNKNKWNQIGDSLGNTPERCAEAYRWHEKNIAKGHFTEEEEAQLIEALKTVSGSSDLSCKKMKGISWETVASHVPSRNGTQCRTYWAYNLAWAPGSARQKWNYQCYHRLVHILKELNVTNSSMIDWYKVYESFEDFAPSALYVQKRWLYISTKISDYQNKSHKEIVDMLSNIYVPSTYFSK